MKTIQLKDTSHEPWKQNRFLSEKLTLDLEISAAQIVKIEREDNDQFHGWNVTIKNGD